MFRAEKSYAVTQGKWYFEFEAVTVGEMRVGWSRPNVRADTELGADELAYVFNGFKVGDHSFYTMMGAYICLVLNYKVIMFLGPTLAHRK